MFNLPFLAYNGRHGSITTLGRMDHGISIFLGQLSSVELSTNRDTVTIGGGTNSKLVTDTLWEAGKQTGEYIIAICGAHSKRDEDRFDSFGYLSHGSM